MKNSVLLLVDIQKGLDEPMWGKRNNPQAEENIATLLGCVARAWDCRLSIFAIVP